MENLRLSWLVFLVVTVIALVAWGYSYNQMPERMASHFNAAGAPNGWMTKNQFFSLNVILIAVAAFSGFFPGRKIAKLPASKINLPNKEYWLDPARREETVAYFQRWFAWFGCAILLLVVLVMQLVIESNRSPTPMLPLGPIMIILFGFLIFITVRTIAMYRRFSKIAG